MRLSDYKGKYALIYIHGGRATTVDTECRDGNVKLYPTLADAEKAKKSYENANVMFFWSSLTPMVIVDGTLARFSGLFQ